MLISSEKISDFEMFYVFQIIPKNPLKLSSFRQKSNEYCIHKPKLHISSTLESEMYLGQGMNETEDTAFFFSNTI